VYIRSDIEFLLQKYIQTDNIFTVVFRCCIIVLSIGWKLCVLLCDSWRKCFRVTFCRW